MIHARSLRRLVFVGLILLLAGSAEAGRFQVTPCDTGVERQAVRDSLLDDRVCRRETFSGQEASTCTSTPPPACAVPLVDEVGDLAWGPLLDPALSVPKGPVLPQWECQKQIGRAAANYPHLWLDARISGSTADEADVAARAELDEVVNLCALNVVADAASGLTLPRVGAQCGAAVPGVGGSVDAPALRDCLGTLLRTFTERIGPGRPPLRPHIVFILTDDQRFDTVRGEHAPPGEVVMPTVVNELIAEGVEFTNAYVTTPLCCPSRTSILSGRYALHHKVWETLNGAGYDDSSTLATWLDAAGYYTALMGKYKNGYQSLWVNGETPYIPPGWDDWFALRSGNYFNYTVVDNGVQTTYGGAVEDYITDVMRDRALDVIDDAVAIGDPLFLYFSTVAPHAPFTAAPRHAGLFSGIAPFRPPNFNEADVSDKPSLVGNKPLISEPYIDNIRKAQLRTLPAVDEAVDAILDRLRTHGILDDTIVVFTSDNGYFWGEHRLEAKNRPYEEAVRVPLVIRYPKLAPLPRVEDRMVLNIDFAGTFAQLAGATVASPTDGRSFVSVIENTAKSWRDTFLTESSPFEKEWVMLHEGQWKYGEYARDPGPNPLKDTELYDLANDPYELENIADDPAQATRVQDMADKLRAIRPQWPQDAFDNRN